MRQNYDQPIKFQVNYATGEIDGFTQGSNTYWYRKNQQGDVTGIFNTAYGNTALFVEYEYDAWGNIISITGDGASTIGQTNPIRYRGYFYDTETGYYYLNSRYYDPTVGRFLNGDVFASTGQGTLGSNMFAYCLNNPVNMVDPSGEIATEILVAAGIIFVSSTVFSAIGAGISAAINGQDFWKGFGAGAIGGAASGLLGIGGLLTGNLWFDFLAGGVGSVITSLCNEWFQNGSLENMRWDIFVLDLLLDMSQGVIGGYWWDEFIPNKIKSTIISGFIDTAGEIIEDLGFNNAPILNQSDNTTSSGTGSAETNPGGTSTPTRRPSNKQLITAYMY